MTHIPNLRSSRESIGPSAPIVLDRPWTKQDVHYRLVEAADTLSRLQMPMSGLPAKLGAVWPQVVYEWTAYGYSPPRVRRTPPSSEAIDRLDATLRWMYLLTDDQRKVVWARADGASWRSIRELDDKDRHGHGRQERQLRNIFEDGEARILANLNGGPRRAVLG